MLKGKFRKLNWLGATSLVILLSVAAQAQQMLPADVEAGQLSDAIAQTTGEFDQVNLNYIHSLGMQQKAWNDPLSHLGEGQTKPGYSKYLWSPDVVLPIRLREGMMTLINFPTWELIEKVHIGSPESFGGEIAAPNSLLVYADPSYIGVDSNMIVFGRSGNRYVFYLRSETYNTDKITQSVVDVLVGPKYTPVENGGKLGNFNGATITASSNTSVSGSAAPGWAGRGSQNPQIGLNTASTGPKDWLKSIPVDPESFRFDIDMYLPNPADVDMAPENVWRDNIFTYIDMGPKALTMTQRPIVNLIVQDTEVPVGFRTRGPNSRLIVVEAIGDLVLRNGKKIICLKLRRDPASGLEYIDYSGSQGQSASWSGKPSTQNNADSNGMNGASDVMGGSASSMVAGSSATSQSSLLSSQSTSAYTEGMNADGTFKAQFPMTMDGQMIMPDMMSGGAAGINAEFVNSYPSFVYTQEMAPMQGIPTEVKNSPSASSGIVGVMNQITTSKSSSSSVSSDVKTFISDKETISVELGTHASMAELETIWDNIYSKNQDLLKGYEPYYSVDATADGDVRELFRLRIGPMKNVKTADTLCQKLGRRGFTCSVVRVQ